MSVNTEKPTCLVNVLEELVLQEAERQVVKLPQAEQIRVNAADVAAYVLNRMYPMYATSRDGWGHQREKALRRVSRDVSAQVLQAIAKMRTAPPRRKTPLPETRQAECALMQVRTLLGQPDLTWVELPDVVAKLVNQGDASLAVATPSPAPEQDKWTVMPSWAKSTPVSSGDGWR